MARKKLFALLGALPVLFAMGMFLLAPSRYSESVRDGISLWAVSVLPATFPFLFLTATLMKNPLFDGAARRLSFLGKVFRVSGAGGCAMAVAAVSGYPVGARTVKDLVDAGRIGGERFRLACLVTTSGPMFLVGVVGAAMWKRAGLGWLLLFAHFFGVWSVSFLMRFFAKREPSAPPLRTSAGSDTLLSSVLSVLCVGGSIALFSAFGQMIADLLPAGTPRLLVVAVRGLVEMTTGCALAAGTPSPLFFAFCAFFVTFGGACVLFQQLAFLVPAGVKAGPFVLVKFLQGLTAAGAAFLLSPLYL